MWLIHSIINGRKIDFGVIVHQEIADCTVRQTGILDFPLLVMLLYQQKGIVPRDDEKVLENKGPINEASIERMTHGKDTLTMKETETNKTRKGKTKTERKGTNLTTETSLFHKIHDIEKLANSISNKQIRLVATIEDMSISQNLFYAYTKAYNNSIIAVLSQSVESPPIIHVSDDKKEEDSRDIEECMQRIDSMVEGDFITFQEVPTVDDEIDVEEEKIHVAVVNEKAEEENTTKESAGNIVNTPEFVGATTNNLE
ncbi:hypothetical protein PVK06_030299 [Gossypium arboreum]|uniref:Uncharacterized protein n=1 Tax=Gossypium arboreum TaxID=29729 RepID=A0ABR0NMX5_GOSAR|nr:hypothetical protein PVK06_030299 [Gossypium arboreum]